MADFSGTTLLNADGSVAWHGQYADRHKAADHLADEARNVPLGFALGLDKRLDGKPKPKGREIFNRAVDLNFLSTRNCLPGFVTVLPAAKIMEQTVDHLNSLHFEQLNCAEISFPILFDGQSEEIRDLTATYAVEGRMFKLGEADAEARLAYAADPGLFLWLKDQRIRQAALPYAIQTQMNVYRRFKRGEVGDFTRLREWPMADLHILCTQDQAAAVYLRNIAIATERMRFLLGEDWTFVLDVTPDLHTRLGEDFFTRLAAAIGKKIVINIFARKPRYYDMRSIFAMDAGDCTIMNFNMQWDEENSARFNFRTETDQPLIVLHGTLMHSWYKFLPVFIAKALTSDAGSQPFPVQIAPVQVCLIPTKSDFAAPARAIAASLETSGVRVAVMSGDKGLSKSIALARRHMIPFYAVVGDREADGEPIQITDVETRQTGDIASFLETHRDILAMTPMRFRSRYDVEDIFCSPGGRPAAHG